MEKINQRIPKVEQMVALFQVATYYFRDVKDFMKPAPDALL
jgi:hypothetical protein